MEETVWARKASLIQAARRLPPDHVPGPGSVGLLDDARVRFVMKGGGLPRERTEQHAKRPPPFKKLARNKFLHRKRTRVDSDVVPVCECLPAVADSNDATVQAGNFQRTSAKTRDGHSSNQPQRKTRSLDCGHGCLNAAVSSAAHANETLHTYVYQYPICRSSHPAIVRRAHAGSEYAGTDYDAAPGLLAWEPAVSISGKSCTSMCCSI